MITRADAHSAGLTNRQVRLRVAKGQLLARGRDVFVVTGAPSSTRQELLVATLRNDAAAALGSSAHLLGLTDRAPHRPHVARASASGVADTDAVVHRLADLVPRDLVTVDSIRSTNATRTVLDLAASLTDGELRSMIDRARRLHLIHPEPLIARFLSHGRQGRPGTARARRVLGQVDGDLALLESDLESALLAAIERGGLPAPSPQHPVSVGGSEYRIDFAYPQERVAIEGDGFAFHSGREVFEQDRTRQNALVLAGWTVLRFTWRQICRHPEDVVAQIEAAIQRSAATAASA